MKINFNLLTSVQVELLFFFEALAFSVDAQAPRFLVAIGPLQVVTGDG
jgi:hypothetical protein